MRRWTLSLLVLALAVSGCAGDNDDTAGGGDELAELAALEGTMSDELIARAQREGSLVVYTSNSDLEDLASVFEERFDIDVSVYRAGSETMVQRALQESRAGRIEADVVETHAPEMELLAREGVLVPYDHGLDDQLRDGSRFDSWTATRFSAFVIAWNTEQLDGGEPPRTWRDLAEDRWNGSLSLEAGDFDWYVTLRQHLIDEGGTEADVDGLFEQIADGARVVDGHTAQAELLGAGEIGVVASGFTHSITDAIEAGAPIAWRPPVEPLIVKAAGVGMVRGQRHPAAAALFYEWLLTDAQELLLDDHRVPSAKGLPDPLEGLATIPIDATVLATEGQTWSSRYQELLR